MLKRTIFASFGSLAWFGCALAQGSWSGKIDWSDPFETNEDIIKLHRAIHMVMLPNGDILYWGWYSDSFAENEHLRVRVARQGANHSYTDTVPAPNLGTNIFCVGHTFLLEAGGCLPRTVGAVPSPLGDEPVFERVIKLLPWPGHSCPGLMYTARQECRAYGYHRICEHLNVLRDLNSLPLCKGGRDPDESRRDGGRSRLFTSPSRCAVPDLSGINRFLTVQSNCLRSRDTLVPV